MFLISLVLFPVVSGYIFNKYKDKSRELNGIIKIIGIIGLFMILLLSNLEIFRNAELYFSVTLIWYIVVFLFFYFRSIILQYKELEKIKYKDFSYLGCILKFLYFLFLFINFINMGDNYHVGNMFGFFTISDSLFSFSFIGTFLLLFLLFGIIFEFVDMLKKIFFIKANARIRLKKQLKEDLKKEILAELGKSI